MKNNLSVTEIILLFLWNEEETKVSQKLHSSKFKPRHCINFNITGQELEFKLTKYE